MGSWASEELTNKAVYHCLKAPAPPFWVPTDKQQLLAHRAHKNSLTELLGWLETPRRRRALNGVHTTAKAQHSPWVQSGCHELVKMSYLAMLNGSASLSRYVPKFKGFLLGPCPTLPSRKSVQWFFLHWKHGGNEKREWKSTVGDVCALKVKCRAQGCN